MWERVGSGLVVAVLWSAGCTPEAGGQARERLGAALDSLLAERLVDLETPGIAVAVIDSGAVVWIGTEGWADVDAQRPVTDSTPFMIASVSKPITATVLLSLWGEGRFGLDDDAGTYLAFPLRNPNHPSVPITFRHLLRHRSSIADNRDYYMPYWSVADGDPTTDLEGYLTDYLSPEGADYVATENFLEVGPDEQRQYCNTCYALLGHLAERISGVPFDRLSEQRLFGPLGMSETGWFLSDFAGPEVAMPYRSAADTGYVAFGHNGYPDWPAGQLRTSIRNLATFMAAYLNAGNQPGESVIDPRIVELLSPGSAEIGFHTWFQFGLGDGQVLWEHGGGDVGVRTMVAFSREPRRAVLVLTNGEGDLRPLVRDLYLTIEPAG